MTVIENSMTTKVCFVGNKKTNKTTITKALVELTHDNFPTLGVEVYTYNSMPYHTYNIWDCAGDPNKAGLGDGYYMGCELFIVFTRDEKYKDDYSLEEWKMKIRRVNENAVIHHVNNATVEDVFDILDLYN